MKKYCIYVDNTDDDNVLVRFYHNGHAYTDTATLDTLKECLDIGKILCFEEVYGKRLIDVWKTKEIERWINDQDAFLGDLEIVYRKTV